MRVSAKKIVETLRNAGFEAYWAGGCVRDMLLGIRPKDFDIATNAKPDEIEKLLKHTIPVGKQFGVIIARVGKHNFEVATFRSDSGYSDGRRPDAVFFTTAREDALRRDFTINALFYDPIEDRVIDYVNGQKDLQERLVRFIGNSEDRILEDHLRILRAVRFKNVYNFQYHPETYKALKEHAHHIKKISKERIREELNTMLKCRSASQAMRELSDIGALNEILPEIEQMKGVAQPYQYHKEGDCFEHAMRSLDALTENDDLLARWAVFLHDVGKPDTFKIAEDRIRFDGHVERSAEITKKILDRLRMPRKFVNDCAWIVRHHMLSVPITEMGLSRRRHWFLHPLFSRLMEVFRCDAEGAIPKDLKLYDEVARLYKEDLKHMPKEPKRFLTGNDVMKLLNIPAGKQVGEILDALREKQLAGEIKSKKKAIEWVTTRQ